MSPRKPNTEYSPHKRGRIAAAYDSGLRPASVARLEGVNRASIPSILKRYRVQKKGASQKRTGRPRTIQPRDIRHIHILIGQDPFISAREIKEQSGLACSERTITRELIRLGIQHYKAIRRPKLSDKLAQQRLAFAKELEFKPRSWFQRLVVSDETTIARGEGEREAWVFCRKVRDLNDIIPQPD